MKFMTTWEILPDLYVENCGHHICDIYVIFLNFQLAELSSQS